MSDEELLAVFRREWGADYLDFYFDRYEDADQAEKFVRCLRSVIEAAS